jgi:hypothetical protein
MFNIEPGAGSFTGRKSRAPGDDYFDMVETGNRAALYEAQSKRPHPLDSHQNQQGHASLMGHYMRELERQASNRMQMATDEAFYDHKQWSDEEIAELAARGQAPLVFNMIQTSVNWVLGSQRRATMDYKILPRVKEGGKSAEKKTQLLKHLSDENRSEHEHSQAFGSAVKAGIGWLETGQASPEDGPIVFDRAENWRAMLWDSTSTRYDLRDARYVCRTKWLDLDVCAALWPERQGVLEMSAKNVVPGAQDIDDMGDDPMDEAEMDQFNQTYGNFRSLFYSDRPRVRVIEMWYKRMVKDAKVLRGGQFNGELFDEWSPGHHRSLIDGKSSLVARPRELIFLAIATDAGLMDLRESPYRHGRFPFTPVWGYRDHATGLPYGLIRGVRDINRDLNKRASKALHHLSSVRVTVEEGAVADIEELRDEAGRPDSVIVHKQGRNAPKIETDFGVAQAHMDLMSRDAQMIQSIAGVTDENLGRKSNATSGKAIVARQDQGQLATSMFFDNLRLSRVIHGEKLLVNVEQFYTEKDQFRVTDMRGNADFMEINDPSNPDSEIASNKADFIISEEDWRASARQAQAEQLLDLSSKLAATAPQMVVSILDLVIEAMDVPKKEELVKRIRQMNGQDDPDADPDNPDQDTIDRKQAQQAQNDLQMRDAEATLGEKEAKARKALAEALKLEGSRAADQIDLLQKAMEAAIAIAGAPAVAQAADRVLMSAQQEAMRDPKAEQQAAQQQQMMQAQQAAQQMQAEDQAAMGASPAQDPTQAPPATEGFMA